MKRLNAELMMFGVVAITLFLLENSIELSHHMHMIFEFVDILCSAGACTLIMVGALVFGMLSHLRRHYSGLTVVKHNFYDTLKLDAKDAKTLEPKFVEFYLLAANLMEEYQLPSAPWKPPKPSPLHFVFCAPPHASGAVRSQMISTSGSTRGR